MRKNSRLLAAIVLTLALAGGAAAGEAPNDLDTDPDLAGWWKFEEPEGQTAADSSTHGRDGALKDGLSFDKDAVPGKVGKALRFGKDQCVEIIGYKGVAGTRPRTVATWIKTETAKGTVLTWGTYDAGAMWIFGFQRSGMGVTPKGGYLYGKSKIHDNQWHHVAAVVHEAELPNLHDDVTLYLNGELEEIDDIGLLDLWPIETGDESSVKIGMHFEGALDEVRIYSRALSKNEIRALAKPPDD
jgi:hypothetical protein